MIFVYRSTWFSVLFSTSIPFPNRRARYFISINAILSSSIRFSQVWRFDSIVSIPFVKLNGIFVSICFRRQEEVRRYWSESVSLTISDQNSVSHFMIMMSRKVSLFWLYYTVHWIPKLMLLIKPINFERYLGLFSHRDELVIL